MADNVARSWRRGAASGLYEGLLARYTEPHRHYHTVRHLEECFAERRPCGADAVGRPRSSSRCGFTTRSTTPRGTTTSSAAPIGHSRSRRGPGSTGRRRARRGVIMATRHDAIPADADAAVLVDVDLSILGAPPRRFDEYEREVREEYARVPEVIFRRERRKSCAACSSARSSTTRRACANRTSGAHDQPRALRRTLEAQISLCLAMALEPIALVRRTRTSSRARARS